MVGRRGPAFACSAILLWIFLVIAAMALSMFRAGSTEGGDCCEDNDRREESEILGLIEGLMPDWSRGAAARPRPATSAVSPLAGVAGDGSGPESLPARPVVEVEGIIPDWVGQAANFLAHAPGEAIKSVAGEAALPALLAPQAALPPQPAGHAPGGGAPAGAQRSLNVSTQGSRAIEAAGRVTKAATADAKVAPGRVALSLASRVILQPQSRVCAFPSLHGRMCTVAQIWRIHTTRATCRPAHGRHAKARRSWQCCRTASTGAATAKMSTGFAERGEAPRRARAPGGSAPGNARRMHPADGRRCRGKGGGGGRACSARPCLGRSSMAARWRSVLALVTWLCMGGGCTRVWLCMGGGCTCVDWSAASLLPPDISLPPPRSSFASSGVKSTLGTPSEGATRANTHI